MLNTTYNYMKKLKPKYKNKVMSNGRVKFNTKDITEKDFEYLEAMGFGFIFKEVKETAE